MEFMENPARKHDYEPLRELRNLAYMYYAMGNYAKSEEILALIRSIEDREAERVEQQQQRKAA